MVIDDLVPAFAAFWADAAALPAAEQLDRWRAYADRHPEVVNDTARWGGVPDGESALSAYPQRMDRIEAFAGRVPGWIAEAAALVLPALGADDLDARCVSMVGLANSNGWVSLFEGRYTLFVAVEQLTGEQEARGLITHELAHVVQLSLGQWPDEGPLGLALYAEGFATVLAAELMPDQTLQDHLWWGTPPNAQWMEEASRAVPEAAREIREHLRGSDSEVERRYFTLRAGHRLPDRVGYLTGVRVLQALRAEHAWPELARWTVPQAIDESERVLRALGG
jgi:hypothetical protein